MASVLEKEHRIPDQWILEDLDREWQKLGASLGKTSKNALDGRIGSK